MAYDTTEAVAKFLSGFQMKITNRERDTVAPDYYVKYSLTLSKGGKDFSTTFVSDPRASGEPTVTQVFSALADDAFTLRKYSTDEFVDKLYAQGVKPSAALRAYDSLKETNLWMQDELYLSGWEIEEISKTLTKHGDEVNTLVEKAASERAARYAYMMRIMRRPMTRRIPSSRLSMPRSRRNMAKTSPTVPTTSYRTTMISRGA